MQLSPKSLRTLPAAFTQYALARTTALRLVACCAAMLLALPLVLRFAIPCLNCELALGPDSGEPVDIVYMYVNGSDPAHQRVVDAVAMAATGRAAMNQARFRDWDELRYSMRSIFTFAPWFRNVHLVISNNSTQVPTWMIRDIPRLRIVPHDSIFPDPATQLPTASSRAIEANVHRIPGLSKRFILMNDDFYFWRPVPKSFFLRSPTTHWICNNAQTAPDERVKLVNPTARQLSVQFASRLLNGRYGYMPRRDDCHAPQVIDRDLMQRLQDTFPAEFAAAIANKARTGATLPVRYTYNQWLLSTRSDFETVSRPWQLTHMISFGLSPSRALNTLHYWMVYVINPYFVASNDDVPDDVDVTSLRSIQRSLVAFLLTRLKWPSPLEKRAG